MGISGVAVSIDIGASNSLTSSSGNSVYQAQPTAFVANTIVSNAFQTVFSAGEEIQWFLESNWSVLPGRQVATANQYSPACGLAPTYYPIQPQLQNCVQQTTQQGASTCTAQFAYFNPNGQPVTIEIGANNQFVSSVGGTPSTEQTYDRQQPRVFFNGQQDGAILIVFDCSSTLWALEWQVTTIGTTAIAHVDQSSVCV